MGRPQHVCRLHCLVFFPPIFRCWASHIAVVILDQTCTIKRVDSFVQKVSTSSFCFPVIKKIISQKKRKKLAKKKHVSFLPRAKATKGWTSPRVPRVISITSTVLRLRNGSFVAGVGGSGYRWGGRGKNNVYIYIYMHTSCMYIHIYIYIYIYIYVQLDNM